MLKFFKLSNSSKCTDDQLMPNETDGVVDRLRNYVNENPPLEFKGVQSKFPLILEVQSKARFVRLSLQTLVSFHLDTIEIIDKNGNNIAVGKKTIVSSTYNNEEKHDGRGALIGRKNGGCGFHTKREHNPWLIIDLHAVYNIKKITIYNREGKFFRRALSLSVSLSENLVEWHQIFDNWKMLNDFKKTKPTEFENAIIHAFVLDPAPSIEFLKRLKAETTHENALKFQSCVNDVVKEKGFAFGPHGFTQTFELRTDEEKSKVANELGKVLEWLNNEFGVAAFVSSGTLLGLVRDGKFIDHDDDVDICYISNTEGEKAILEERESIVAFLRDKGCRLTPSGVAHYWCMTPGKQHLDIFTGFMEGDNCSMNPFSRNEVKMDAVLPLQTSIYHGATLYLPAKPEILLEANYGPDWKVPDPLWSFNWSKSKKDFGFLYF